jgi:hypothetical protein
LISLPPSIVTIGRTRDAGRRHVDQDERDAFLLLRGLIGAREHEDHVRELRERDPRLLAVDDVVVAVAVGARFERREIGAGFGFRIALAPPVVAAQNARQVARFCSSLPNSMMTGATIETPNGICRGAPPSAISSSKMCF